MAKKDLQSVTANLSGLAATLPTQKPVAPHNIGPVPVRTAEKLVQFSLSMRPELRKQLDRLAADADMTTRAFVLREGRRFSGPPQAAWRAVQLRGSSARLCHALPPSHGPFAMGQ